MLSVIENIFVNYIQSSVVIFIIYGAILLFGIEFVFIFDKKENKIFKIVKEEFKEVYFW